MFSSPWHNTFELLSKRIIIVEALPGNDVQQTTNLAMQAVGPNTAIRFQVCLDTVKKILILIFFRLDQMSFYSQKLNLFSFWLRSNVIIQSNTKCTFIS